MNQLGRQVKISVLGFILVLAGCSPLVEPAPTPVRPTAVIAALSPAVIPIEKALYTCAELQPELVIFTDITSDMEETPPGVDLFFRFGPPTQVPPFAAPVAQEEIVVIANNSNPQSFLSALEIRALFEGSTANWADLGGTDLPVQVWIYPEKNEIRTVFESWLWDSPPIFSRAYIAPGPLEMLEAIAAEPGAVGAVPKAWLDDTVQKIPLPDEAAALLRQPVLALAAAQPTGPTLELLGCLQNGPGKQQLLEIYSK